MYYLKRIIFLNPSLEYAILLKMVFRFIMAGNFITARSFFVPSVLFILYFEGSISVLNLFFIFLYLKLVYF
jgi:hypothetical protein